MFSPLDMHVPVVKTDGGPWALHDAACPVCSEHKAILDIGTGVFKPCSICAHQGWEIGKRSRLSMWLGSRLVADVLLFVVIVAVSMFLVVAMGSAVLR